MRKLVKTVGFCMVVVILVTTGVLLADRQNLRDSLIRFHVVANSDSEADQDVKLLVRDAVIQSIQDDLSNVADVGQAKAYLQENLPKIENLANSVLKAAGFEENVKVSLCKEAFDMREYDTFTLPSGVYEALRIVIGKGEGHNWWCVTFPALCIPATSETFVETASQAGFTPRITSTLTQDDGYEVHFYLLDVLGRFENCVFGR